MSLYVLDENSWLEWEPLCFKLRSLTLFVSSLCSIKSIKDHQYHRSNIHRKSALFTQGHFWQHRVVVVLPQAGTPPVSCVAQYCGGTRCGVGSHHQNGRAKNRIKVICEPARSMLIHAIHRWPEVIIQALWPYAVLLAVDIRNKSKLDTNGLSALDKLTTVKHNISVKDDHTFGCPAYVLQA